MTVLIISNEEMDVIMEVVKCLEESSLWIKGVSKTIKKWSKRTKRWISWHVIRNISTSLLGNLLTGSGVIWAGEGAITTSLGREANIPGWSTITAGQDF